MHRSLFIVDTLLTTKRTLGSRSVFNKSICVHSAAPAVGYSAVLWAATTGVSRTDAQMRGPLLNVDATQCIAYSPEAKVARPNSASTLGPPRVYEPKVMAQPTLLSHTHLRIRLSPSPLVPRPSPFDPRCQASKKLPSPPRVYEQNREKAHAISHQVRDANVRATFSTLKHEFVPSSRVSWSTRSMRRDKLDLLRSFETTHQVRAAIEQERWRAMSVAQRGGSAPRVYEPSTTSTSPTPLTTSSRPSTAGSRARSSGHLMVTFDLPSSTRSTVLGSRPSTASGIRTSSTLPRNPRDAPGAAPDTATVQPSLFSFGFLGEPAKREWMWDARVNRAAGGSLPPVPSDSHLLF